MRLDLLIGALWSAPNSSSGLMLGIFGALALGLGLIAAFLFVPIRARKIIIGLFTFVSGLVYVLYFVWPQPFDRKPNDLPLNAKESVGFWLNDAIPVVGSFSNILTAFLLGLGIYSLLRIHIGRVAKQQRDWGYSIVLLMSMFTMAFFGYANWLSRQGPAGAKLELPENWGIINRLQDLLFDGLLQQMDAAMFSLIAFFILSAAYRAFRIRSIEATILLATALLMMLSLMGLVVYFWDSAINTMSSNPNSFIHNLSLTSIAKWVRDTLQTPGIRAIDFGIGIGALAMGLRLWLGLERGGTTS